MSTKIGAEARLVAARALAAVLDQRRNLGDALADLDRQLGDSRDRALVRRLCNRVLRDFPALEWRLNQLLRKPLGRKAREIHFLLLLALDQLIEGREPAHAVVHASVAAARSAGQHHLSGLVNAVLRNQQRRAAELEDKMPRDPALRLGYPGWLLDAIRRDWPAQWREIAEAGNRKPPVWLRVNRRRSTPDELCRKLAEAGIKAGTSSHFPDAVRLDHPARVSSLPGFAEGEFSVQDAGAQAAAALLELEDGQRVLDACAAPGGKAAHILECCDAELTALEMDPARAERIRETFKRLGLAGEVVVGDAAAPGDWAGTQLFDRILVDAPCSATGVLRRHPDIRWQRQPGDVVENAALQGRILDALWPLLAPGGLLVYASCSILHAENRDQARDFIARHADAQPLDTNLDESVATDPGRQILPGSLDRDGFYYLRLRRLHRQQCRERP
ncbi:MAG TPA: 16S rRNA (cytosine(967)-C(5))-methyltransferase RsmB [Wenzhouxiangellaceae bacterium]|nr:16S rRNA (cytosine(967)-C(5))-methyltransferase RsmB [Wenzhouxiangellaceae bacterium]